MRAWADALFRPRRVAGQRAFGELLGSSLLSELQQGGGGMSWANALFRPRCVAVVGSVSEGKIGRVLIDQLLHGGFSDVVAVNPKRQGIDGVRAVSSFGDLPVGSRPVDLAVVATPAATVVDVLEDAGRAGVQVAVIITAGFAEAGHPAAEDRLVRAASQHGLRLIGPNCAGIVNTKWNLFPTLETRPPSGDVAFVSQSGALGGAVLSWAEEQGVGFSKFVSYGNGADLTDVDFLEALREDEETRVVALYIETISDGRAFLRAAADLAAVKPLIVIKSGRSDSGSRATLSHTGSMAGADAVFDAALRQSGAIRAAGIEEMFDLCRGFTMLPAVEGRRLAIVTNSGGPAVLAADRAETSGLRVDPPTDGLRDRLKDRLEPFCSTGNPIDLTVQATKDDYRDVLIDVLDEYDAALALNVNTPYLDSAPLACGVAEAARATGKPVAASFMAGVPARAALPVLRAAGVPNFATGERAVQVLAALAQRATCLALAKAERVSEATIASADSTMQPHISSRLLPWEGNPLEPEAMEWLETLGFPVIERRWVRAADEAATAARTFGRSIAMKAVSRSILHKTDVGGVILDVSSPDEAIGGFERLRAIGADDGVLITPMFRHAVEILVGLSTDLQFGPVIAVGSGGILTETMRDLSLRVAPVSRTEARRMIDELHGRPLLDGTRGLPPCDVDALTDVVVRVSRLALEYPDIRELDLNPIFCTEGGCAIADVRLLRFSQDNQEEDSP